MKKEHAKSALSLVGLCFSLLVIVGCSSGPTVTPQERVNFAADRQRLSMKFYAGKTSDGVDKRFTKIRCEGADSTSYTVENPEFDSTKAEVYRKAYEKVGTMATLKEKGFTKLVVTNGAESWSFDVD